MNEVSSIFYEVKLEKSYLEIFYVIVDFFICGVIITPKNREKEYVISTCAFTE